MCLDIFSGTRFYCSSHPWAVQHEKSLVATEARAIAKEELYAW
jgi:hypothetical protein